MNTDSTNTGVHIAQVIGANASAWTIAFTHINELLTTLSLVLASAYTLYKLVSEWNRKK